MPKKTDLRRGLVAKVRRPRAVMQPLSTAELHTLRGDEPDELPPPVDRDLDPPRP